MMKKFYTFLTLALLALTAQAQDDLTWWGYFTNQSTGITGNNQVPGSYEAAMFVAGDGDLKGVSIESIRIQTRLSASSSENVVFWIRTALDGENVVEVTPASVSSSGYTTVTLPNPYALPETGAYVGYSFRVTQWWNEYEGTPVVYGKTAVPNSFYLKKPGETTFTDMSSTGCLAAQVGFKAPAVTMWWGNYTGTEQTGLAGNNKVPGSYEAAMFVAGDGALKDADITAIRIQTRLSASSSENVKFWLRSALDGENLVEVTPETVAGSGYTTVQLPEAYKIPAEGVYVGYSFRVTQWWNEYEGTPVVYARKVVEKGFYLKQPEEAEFTDKSSTGCLAAQIEVSSSSMTSDAAQVADDLDDIVALVGQPVSVSLNITNQGAAGVQSIGYVCTVDGVAGQEHTVVLPTPIDAMLGAKAAVAVELDALTAAGQQEVEIEITKVNGNANGITGKKTKCSVYVTAITESAPRKAVAEIFVGASQYNSPRGYVGAELLAKNENIIPVLIDYYSGTFAVSSYADFQKNYNATSFTNKYATYPVAEVNRAFTTDPYFGNTAAPYHYASEPLIAATLSEPTEAAVTVEADWSKEDADSVVINATATFKADFKSAPYRLAFVLVADGLVRDVNNYVCYQKTNYPDDDMYYWREGDGASYTVKEYVHNNMAIASSDVTGIAGSLPKNITAGVANSCESGLKMPAWEGQEPTNVRVLALLINKDTKRIVNAAIAPVGATATAIETVKQPAAQQQRIYNLNGQLVKNAQKGLYIIDGRKVMK